MSTQNSLPELSRVAVVTVSYGSGGVLVNLLQSLRGNFSAELPVIVADNKPDSDSVESIASSFDATYLAFPENPGYGGAVNRAVSLAAHDARWILVCNPDLEIAPDAIELLVATAESDERIGAVGPRILQPDGSTYPSARAIPSLRTGIGHALFANLWKANPWSAKYHNANAADGAREAGWLSGACFLIKKPVFDQLGGFDEGYFMYFEDVDLGYRLGKLGYTNVYEPRAQVTHIGATSTQNDSSRMLKAHHDSAARFLARKYSHPLLWPLRTVLKIGLKLRSTIASKRTG